MKFFNTFKKFASYCYNKHPFIAISAVSYTVSFSYHFFPRYINEIYPESKRIAEEKRRLDEKQKKIDYLKSELANFKAKWTEDEDYYEYDQSLERFKDLIKLKNLYIETYGEAGIKEALIERIKNQQTIPEYLKDLVPENIDEYQLNNNEVRSMGENIEYDTPSNYPDHSG